jgi:hypothetical protein
MQPQEKQLWTNSGPTRKLPQKLQTSAFQLSNGHKRLCGSFTTFLRDLVRGRGGGGGGGGCYSLPEIKLVNIYLSRLGVNSKQIQRIRFGKRQKGVMLHLYGAHSLKSLMKDKADF